MDRKQTTKLDAIIAELSRQILKRAKEIPTDQLIPALAVVIDKKTQLGRAAIEWEL